MKSCRLKIIGTNSTTKHLDGLLVELDDFVFNQKPQVLPFEINNEIHLFDIKTITFCSNGVLLCGFASDEKNNVGRISLKYLP